MLNFYPMLNPSRPAPRKPTLPKSSWLSICLLLAVACAAPAQTLARPGWTASGFSADPWWKHAVFYRIKHIPTATAFEAGAAPPSAMDWVNDPKTIAAKLDTLQSLRVDAVILPMPAQQDGQAATDRFDELMRQASLRGVHVLLEFPVSATSGDLPARARLWLSHGVAGFYVVPSPQGSPEASETAVQMLRKIASSAVGGRIVISNLDIDPGRRYGTTAAARAADQTGAQLQVDSRFSLPTEPDAGALRHLLAQEPADANLLVDLRQLADPLDLPPAYEPLSKAIAAISLTTRPVALIDADAELSQSSSASSMALADWYRLLIALHHGNATLRYGSATPLSFDAQNALVWVSRASAGTGLADPVVVACNLSSSPIHLSLGPAIRALNLHGSYLRTLLRTDKGMGPQDLDSVLVPPYSVYIGELHR
jgi:hypothetical protein